MTQPKTAYFSVPDQNEISFHKKKSLFHAKKNCGLPIGNLTSQVFANIICPSSTIILNII